MRGPLDILMNCQEATRELSRAMDAPLPWTRRFTLRLHIIVCCSCRRIEQQLNWLRELALGLRDSENELPVRLSAESKEKMKQRLAAGRDYG